MKTALLMLLLVLLQIGSGGFSLTRIAKTNKLKQAAAEAYQAGRFQEAAEYYNTLILQWEVNSDAVRLNRAHALFLAGQKEASADAYRQIIETTAGKAAKSIAFQQLGYLASQEEKLPDALQYFKDALKADYTNETARVNYEIAWRKLQEENKKAQQEQKEKDQPEDQPQIEPSAWALQQKAKADALYRQFRYADALKLMQESLQQDASVAAYNDYMRRLQDIVEIDQ